MQALLDKLEAYRQEIASFTGDDEKQIEEFRIKWLGTKGIVKTIMSEMKNVPVERKKEAGQLLNDFKQFVEEKFAGLKGKNRIRFFCCIFRN